MTKIKLFNVTSMNFGFTLNVTFNYLDYRYLQNCHESWYCIECCSTIFPLNSLSSNKSFLACCTGSDSNFIQSKELENDDNSSLLLKSSPNLELLVNQFNDATPENNNVSEKASPSKYYDINEMHNIKNIRKINHYPYSILINVLLIKIFSKPV